MRPIHALPVVLVAAALAGCGGGGDDSSTTSEPAATQTQTAQTQTKTRTTAPAKGPDGAKVFASAGCASCHTLAAANATGQVGPNLDDLQPDAATVRSQVENGGGGMPSFSGDLSPEEIDAVATYVADNAGR
ncbi:MAG TPA: cytochrome c [Conexibacter sp.]|jgi:mono/diheme cytochrome c family protein|nr:cytochrome c [Conexibacter sp.]